MKDIVEFIRALTRPFCLVVMVLCITAMVYQGREVPTWFWATFAPSFAWWSTDRTIKHHYERKRNLEKS